MSVHPNPEPDEMSKPRNRGRPMAAAPTPFDQARDELFQHVMRCGVIGSAPEHRTEWFDETMKYLGERYHELSQKQLTDLRVLGERFAAPTVKRPTESVASVEPEVGTDADADANDAPEGELDAVSAA